MIAERYEQEIRTICLLALANCRLPVARMSALARRPLRPAAVPAAEEDELSELVRRLRESFVYDHALDPDLEAW